MVDRDSTSRVLRVHGGRGLRCRAIVAGVLALAACSHGPTAAPGESASGVALTKPGSTPMSSTTRTAIATSNGDEAREEHIDGRHTFEGGLRARGASRSAATRGEAAVADKPDALPLAEVRGSAPDETFAATVPEDHNGDATGAENFATGATAGSTLEAGGLQVATGGSLAIGDSVTVMASSGTASPVAQTVAPAIGKPAAHPGAATVAASAQRSDKARIHERAKWWLGTIVVAFLLFLIAGRRRRRPQRAMNMKTSRREPVATNPPIPSLRKPIDTQRVRMFSIREFYKARHDSHGAAWEAPMTVERGCAHRYELGEEAAEGLLFVAEAEPVQAPTTPVLDAVEPTSCDAMPWQGVIGPVMPWTVPVEPDARCSPSHAQMPGLIGDRVEHAAESPVLTSGSNAAAPRLPVEAAIATVDAITPVAIEPDADAGHLPRAPAVMRYVDDRAPAEPTAAPYPVARDVQPAGAAKPGPGELGLSTSTSRDPDSAAVTAAPMVVAPMMTSHRDPIAEARTLVDAGEYASALAHLDEALQVARPSTDAWVMSALCWWQIARADGGSQAYANAADAMERLLERDPSQTDIWYRSGSCRLLQAAGQHGAAKRATLDLAVAALRRAVPDGSTGDPLRALTLGDALSERALAATDETTASRARRMDEAVHVLRDAARLARDPTSVASWKLQQALQMHASLLPATQASKVRIEADAVLAAGVESASEQERLSWYAARVENELAHAELAEGASRTLHLRTFRENYRDVLTGPDAAPELLLGWLELLALETRHLRGEAARSRFDEGEAILKRLESMLPGNAHVALARARLLRRRAAQSNAVSRPAALSDAIAGLMPLVERGDSPQLQLEAAELMLDRAACVPSAQAGEAHARAEAMASGLLEHPMFAMPAARCVLQARLGQSPGTIDPVVCRRLDALAGDDVRSRWLLARAALRNGAPREACGHCEQAAKSGVRLDPALVQLWDQASRQWNATLHGQTDAAWLANKQSLRSAS